MLTDAQREDLIAAARSAALTAYCPHSHFRVGAAVLANGKVYTGCNVENDSYSLTMCAERVAVFNAVAAGNRKLTAIAISCPDARSPAKLGERVSCGACRQVLRQFSGDDLQIIIDGIGTVTLGDILPNAFMLAESPSR